MTTPLRAARVDAAIGRPTLYYAIPTDVPEARPGVICETCRSRPVRPALEAYCSGACRSMDRALTDHAAALAEGDPATIVATRTKLRAVAEVYDRRTNATMTPDPEGWYQDVAAGLLADLDYPTAIRLAQRDMGLTAPDRVSPRPAASRSSPADSCEVTDGPHEPAVDRRAPAPRRRTLRALPRLRRGVSEQA